MEINHTTGSAAMVDSPCWQISDLIDYELLLEKAQAEPVEAELAETRTREMIAERHRLIVGAREDTSVNRRIWLWEWMAAYRHLKYGDEDSPGKIMTGAQVGVSTSFIIGGGLLGVSVIGGVLAARGTAVNVVWVFWVCMFPQLVLFAAAAGVILAQRAKHGLSPVSILRSFATGLLRPIVAKVGEICAKGEFPNQAVKAQIAAGAGLLLGRGRLHSEALTWPMIVWLQWGAVSYNAAMVSVMIAATIGSSLPAGWQTSWENISPERVSSAVRVVATPWRWAYDKGHPSAEQVRQSQITRGPDGGVRQSADSKKEPAAEKALYAWWPFLTLTLIIYALFPRTMLLLYSRWRLQRALADEDFQDARSDRLFRRLVRQDVVIDSPREPSDLRPVPQQPDPSLPPDPPSSLNSECLVVLAKNLDSPAVRSGLEKLLDEELGWKIGGFYPAYSAKEQRLFLESLAAKQWVSGVPRVFFVKRDNEPIVANLKHLVRSICELIKTKGHLFLGIGGSVDLLGDRPKAESLIDWQDFANEAKLISPNIDILPLKK